MNGETLAKIIVEDLGLPTSYELDISNQVKNALYAFKKAKMPSNGGNSYYGSKASESSVKPVKKEKYCTIILDLEAEGVSYRDQFEWDIYNKRNSPGEFAKVLVEDMGLPPCFERLINFEISQQVVADSGVQFQNVPRQGQVQPHLRHVHASEEVSQLQGELDREIGRAHQER